jgi:hypothetical protein
MSFICTVKGVGRHPENSELAKKFQPDINDVGKRVAQFFSSLEEPNKPSEWLPRAPQKWHAYFAKFIRYSVSKTILEQYKAELTKGTNHGKAMVNVLSKPSAGLLLSMTAILPDTGYQFTALASAAVYLNTSAHCKNKRLVGKADHDKKLIASAEFLYDLARTRAGDFSKREFGSINCKTRKRTVDSGFRFVVALLNWARSRKVGYCGGGRIIKDPPKKKKGCVPWAPPGSPNAC